MTLAKTGSRSTPQLFLFRDRWLPAKEIAALLGVHKNTVYNRRIGDRIAEGDELVDPYREPAPNAVMIQIGGESHCIAEWAKIKGMSNATLKARLRRGWPAKLAVTAPVASCGGNKPHHRNRRIIDRIASTTRRERNTRIIQRMIEAIHTGGWSTTSSNPTGTGAGSREIHSEGVSA